VLLTGREGAEDEQFERTLEDVCGLVVHSHNALRAHSFT
jgi:hypothetical protein